jgi:hypothetical protein
VDHERAAMRAHDVRVLGQRVILEVLEAPRRHGAGVCVRELRDQEG